MSELIERAQGILNQLAANSGGRVDASAFAEKVMRAYPDLAATLIASWAVRHLDIGAAAPDKPAAGERLPRIQTLPRAQERPATTTASPVRGLPAARDEAAIERVANPIETLPPVSRPVQNPPRVSVAAIAGANQRLAQSLLDTWTVNGRKFGDCRVGEVVEACDKRDSTTRLMRAVVADLPDDAVIRKVLTAETAEHRRQSALARQPPAVCPRAPAGDDRGDAAGGLSPCRLKAQAARSAVAERQSP